MRIKVLSGGRKTIELPTVKVYNGNSNEPAYVFFVLLTGNGRYWTVFKYNSKTRRVTSINIVGSAVQTN